MKQQSISIYRVMNSFFLRLNVFFPSLFIETAIFVVVHMILK